MFLAICVSMIPGSTMATRMLNALPSWARHSLSASSANLDAVYAAIGATATCPATEATLMMHPLASLSHRRQDGLAAPDDPEVVGFHDRAELRQRQLLDRPYALDAGVVDQHVDRADLAVDPRHPVAHRGIGVHVHRDHGDGETLPRGGLRQGGGAGRVAHGGGHPVAGAPERERGGQADAGAGPGDQDGRHMGRSRGGVEH